MKCLSLIKSTARSLSGLLLIRLYVSLHLRYLGGDRKGKAPPVLAGRAPRSLRGRVWPPRAGTGEDSRGKALLTLRVLGHQCTFLVRCMGGCLCSWETVCSKCIPSGSISSKGIYITDGE